MSQYPEAVQPVTDPLCQASGCRATSATGEQLPPSAGPRPAVPGTALCTVHHGIFARALNELVGVWADLQTALYRSPKGPKNSGVQTSGVSDLSSSWNPYASEVMADITEWTSRTVNLVLAWHPVPPPELRVWIRKRTTRDPSTGKRTVREYEHKQIIEFVHSITAETETPVALATLQRHYARWLSGYPGEDALGPALLADALRLLQQARAAVQQDSVRRVGTSMGFLCLEQVDVPGLSLLACDAPMSILLDAYGKPGALVCSRHPRTHRVYPPVEWMGWDLG